MFWSQLYTACIVYLPSVLKIPENPHLCPRKPYNGYSSIYFLLSQDTLEICSKEQEFKSILFSLCYFHACVAGRLRFGPQGWSRSYPFNSGDLTICSNILYNYLEANANVSAGDQITFQGMYGIYQPVDTIKMDYKLYLGAIIEIAKYTYIYYICIYIYYQVWK